MRTLNYGVPKERRIGLNRLLRLAYYLETVKKDNFDYNWWCRRGPACGTTACALGHAAMMKSLRDRRRCGLRLQFTDCGNGKSFGEVTLGHLYGKDAGAGAFALTTVESEYLFDTGVGDPSLKRSPKKVAAKIRKFAKAELKNLDKGILPFAKAKLKNLDKGILPEVY